MDDLPGLPAGYRTTEALPQRTAPAPPTMDDPAGPALADHTVVHRPTLQAEQRVRKLDTRDPDFLFREDSGWVFAPGPSHISRWMAVEDSQTGEFLLLVRFKTGKGAGEGRTYAYTFESFGSLDNIAELLQTSFHPYSKVLLPLVIRAGVPYR